MPSRNRRAERSDGGSLVESNDIIGYCIVLYNGVFVLVENKTITI